MCECVLSLVIVEWKSGRVGLVLGRRGVLVHSTSEQRTLRNLDFALRTFQQHTIFLSCL